MTRFSLTAAIGATLAAGAIALAAPALASIDGGADSTASATSDTSSSDSSAASTRTSGAVGARDIASPPSSVAEDVARMKVFQDAVRSGAIHSTRPVAGLDDTTSDPGDLQDVTAELSPDQLQALFG